MINDKGDWAFNLAYENTIRIQRSRIKQLEDYIKKHGLKVPRRKSYSGIVGGYTTDSEE